MTTADAPKKRKAQTQPLTDAEVLEKELFTLPMVAHKLSMSLSTVKKLIGGKVAGAPRLKTSHVGRYVYVTVKGFATFMDELEKQVS